MQLAPGRESLHTGRYINLFRQFSSRDSANRGVRTENWLWPVGSFVVTAILRRRSIALRKVAWAARAQPRETLEGNEDACQILSHEPRKG
jgi:hypothetical protein